MFVPAFMLAIVLPQVSAPGAKAPASPGPRRAYSLVYDESRARTVLFGGGGATKDAAGLDVAWSWNGKRWAALEVKGPSVRENGAFVFDAKRGCCLLIGGSFGEFPSTTVFDETWTLDAKSWTKGAAGVGKRLHCACAYDRKRERVVVIGGVDPATGKNQDDVIEWDGAEWAASTVHAPSALFAPQMAFEEKAGVLILTNTAESDNVITTWSFDGHTFAKLDEHGPALIPSGESLASLGPAGGLLLFGGWNKVALADTWTWDGKSWKKLDVHGPPARMGHSLVYDRKRSKVVLYGGEDGKTTLDDLWEFDGHAWTSVKGT